MDLFDYSRRQELDASAPLPRRMRPRNLEEFVGQEHIVGEGCLLRRLIELDRLTSLIFYGPPGSGKTALAQVIAGQTAAHFHRLNAVMSGVSELREVIRAAKDRLGEQRKRTILFIDEIHRFNKAQQDALLPAVEDGVVILIGATTENPYFEVNKPLVSRSRIFEFEPLGEQAIGEIMANALRDEERGLGEFQVAIEDEAWEHIVQTAGGDARSALNSLELSVLTAQPEDGVHNVTLDLARDATQKRAVYHDKSGDNHYDTISAYIKSIRGSDPDAAIYWLARMLYAGEDPRFIARRLIVHAAEDIGNADPMALQVAVAAFDAVEYVGLPEARIPLTQATAYLASAPKSNACVKAIGRALEDVEQERGGPVPAHLQDTHYRGSEELGRGEGYEYPHSHPHALVRQSYFPEGMEKKRYYEPENRGCEAEIKKRLKEWRAYLERDT